MASSASGNPQTVQVSVSTVISISGLTNVSFTNAVPGQTSSLAPAEHYTVTSNDGAGYSLQETAGNSNFQGPSPSTSPAIPDSAWSITIEANGIGGTIKTFSPSGTSFTAYSSTTGPSSDTFVENWDLQIPSTLAAGQYNNSLTYLALGN
jgi:hypothetical protein